MNWLVENMGSIVVGLVILALVWRLVAGLIRDKKNGKCTCGSCDGCSAGCGTVKRKNDRNNP